MRPAPDTGSSSSSSSCGLSSAARPGERPKTEDFLTFLCLRGTDFLPPELDFFNQVTRLVSWSMLYGSGQASTAGRAASSEESSSEGDDSKDPEVDKNGSVKKSKRLSNLKTKKEGSSGSVASSVGVRTRGKEAEPAKSKENKNSNRKTRSHSQDSLSSPERKASSPRLTRSQQELHHKQTSLKPSQVNLRKVKESDLKTGRISRYSALHWHSILSTVL